MDDIFLDAAFEGERLCKEGHFHQGIKYLEEAIHRGSDDKELLCAVFVELGNAHLCVNDYEQALKCHKYGLDLTRVSKSLVAEAQSWGRLGQTLKALLRYDEGIVCCQQQLRIAKQIGDKVCEVKACYNLAGICSAKAQHLNRESNNDPGNFPIGAQKELKSASEFYRTSLKICEEIGDRFTLGRLYGCLGNVHYLLGEFSVAINFHHKHLQFAKEFSNKDAERRAVMNIANAHTFLGEFEEAVANFKMALKLSTELGNFALEAQTCFSLASIFVVLCDYKNATELYSRHLYLLQRICDCSSGGDDDDNRPCWHFTSTYKEIGETERALDCARKHVEMIKAEGDETAVTKALAFYSELAAMVTTTKRLMKDKCKCDTDMIFDFVSISSESGVPSSITSFGSGVEREDADQEESDAARIQDESFLDRSSSKSWRRSMERLDILPLTPEKTKQSKYKKTVFSRAFSGRSKENIPSSSTKKKNSPTQGLPMMKLDESEVETFLDAITRFQGRRLDDQRTSPSTAGPPQPDPRRSSHSGFSQDESFFDLLSRTQSRRINDQRCSSSMLQPPQRNRSLSAKCARDDNDKENSFDPKDQSFLELLADLQATQITSQRAAYQGAKKYSNQRSKSVSSSEEPRRRATGQALQPLNETGNTESPVTQQPPTPRTHPDEDFFAIIERLQCSRIEDQRCRAPPRLAVLVENPTPEPTPSKLRVKSLTLRPKQKTGRSLKKQ